MCIRDRRRRSASSPSSLAQQRPRLTSSPRSAPARCSGAVAPDRGGGPRLLPPSLACEVIGDAAGGNSLRGLLARMLDQDTYPNAESFARASEGGSKAAVKDRGYFERPSGDGTAAK
eukprot:2100908-Alexandrium_andersonii.AAC.1